MKKKEEISGKRTKKGLDEENKKDSKFQTKNWMN